MNIVSGLIIKNEEWIIGKTLESLSVYCSTIIVLDDNSTDNTAKICQSFPKVKYLKYRDHPEYKMEEGKKRIVLWNEIKQHNPDYVLLLDGDEIPTPSIVNFLNKIDTNVNCWKVRMVNLWKDENTYRVDKFKTSRGANINHDPFSENAWRKTVLLKYDKNYNYIYDEKCEKGPVSKFHPLPDNTPEVIKNTEDFYIIHYGKMADSFTTGKKNMLYAKMEEYEGRGSFQTRLLHHETCRLEGTPIYKTCPESWFWNIEDRGETVIEGGNIFSNANGTISNYNLNEKINLLGLIETVKHGMRSNHYHPVQTQQLLVVSGKALSISKDLNKYDSKIKVQMIKAGDLVITPPYVAHTNIYLEKTVQMNLVNGNRDKDKFGIHTINYELVSESKKKEYIKEYETFIMNQKLEKK